MKKIVLFMFLISIITTAFDKKNSFTLLQDTGLYNNFEQINKLVGSNEGILSLDYSLNNKFLISRGRSNIIKIWDVSTGEVIKTLEGDNDVESVTYSPDNKFIASGESGSIKIWNVSTGNCIKTLEVEKDEFNNNSGVSSLKYSPDGKFLACSIQGVGVNYIKILNTSTYNFKLIKDVYVNSLKYSADGKFLIGNSYMDFDIKIWDVSTGKCVNILKGHSYLVDSISCSPNGKLLASTSVIDKTIKIWDISTGKCLKTIDTSNNPCGKIAYSPNGNYLAGASNNKIVIWDISSGKSLDSLELDSYVNFIAYSPNGNYLASGEEDGSIRIFSKPTTYKSRTKNNSYVKNDNQEIIGTLPKDIVTEISPILNKIYKPLYGVIDSKDFEFLYNNNENVRLYTLVTTPVYMDINKTKTIGNIEKGTVLDHLYYSFNLDMYYIENETIKGWIESANIELLERSKI